MATRVAFQSGGEVTTITGTDVEEAEKSLHVFRDGERVAYIPYDALVYVVQEGVEISD